jgi:hypothetical protein
MAALSFSPCGRRWLASCEPDEGWPHNESQHPSPVSPPLRAVDPPSPARGEGKQARLWLGATSWRGGAPAPSRTMQPEHHPSRRGEDAAPQDDADTSGWWSGATSRQPCICSSDDIRPLLSVCVGLAPVAPPAPLVVFCRNFCNDCWNVVAALVVFDDDGAFACACDAANTLELPTADAVMMSSPKRKPMCPFWLGLYG